MFTGRARTRALMGVLVLFFLLCVCVCVCLSWMREEGCVLTLATLKTIYDNLWYESNSMRSTWLLSKPRYIAIRTLPPKLWYFMIRIQQRQYYSAIQLQGYRLTQPLVLVIQTDFYVFVWAIDFTPWHGDDWNYGIGMNRQMKSNLSGLSIKHNL